jgi:hypothetical protein
MRIALAVFLIGAAVRFLFAQGDETMVRASSVMMFLGGVGMLAAALWDRWERRRRSSPR